MLDKIVVLKKLFFKGFILSLIYYIALTILYILGGKDWLVNILDKYYGINPHDGLIMCGYYLSLVEIITINLLLIPALALHWLTHCLKKEQK